MDLRAFLGLPSAAEELRGLLDIFRAREQDHRVWMEDLIARINDGEPFTKALDPRDCAFGRWYYSYHTDNLVVASQLKRIEAPHAQLHAGGANALRLLAEGLQQQALAAAKDLRHRVFHQTLALLQEAQRMVEEEAREVALVVRNGAHRLALAVDAAEAVEPVHALPAESRQVPLVEGYARRARGVELVMLLDLDRVLAEVGWAT